MAIIEKKPGKKQIDEEMVDRIVEETKQRKNLKEQIYDKITLPVWALDVLIVLLDHLRPRLIRRIYGKMRTHFVLKCVLFDLTKIILKNNTKRY